ncbi:MAG: ATP-dependent endonuclease [Thalassobius sp.]|nr:ATP-dependent endonuclease [Thalassovita sp.]
MSTTLKDYIEQKFPFTPTTGQRELFSLFENFISNIDIAKQIFLLKGFAGTGKTSTISALVNSLRFMSKKSVLLAPTGRAAKVMSFYAKKKAFTIHKVIFKQTEDPNTGRLLFKRQRNYSRHTIFIIDEASMIDNNNDVYGKNGLLDELIRFVFEVPDSGNKLILVGDTAQLPPVHQDLSPALDPLYIEKIFNAQVTSHLLTEVVRQQEASGILENATTLRLAIAKKSFRVQLNTKPYKDIFRMTSQKLEDGMQYAYNKFGIENSCIITRSNRSAVNYNMYLRKSLLFYENEVEAGDFLMIVRNNYFWLSLDSQAGFLANGEFVEVMRSRNHEEVHGFRFADLTLRLVDYPDEPEFEAKVLLDTLQSPNASLPSEDMNNLYRSVVDEYNYVETEKERNKLIKNDPYLNALQVKYAYALTCHKSQGGQWEAVFVDLGYMTEDMKNIEFLRWLYTAITRSSKELYLINFPTEFFSENT